VTAATEVRSIGPEAFETVYPLLQRLPNRVMSKREWRWVLFDYPWAAGQSRGWTLCVHGRPVGFIGAVFSTRPLLGRLEKFCNPSCWVVLDEHRYAAALLLRPILALADHTILSLLVSRAVYRVYAGLGFRLLEREQLLLAPIAAPRHALHALRGSFTLEAREIAAELTGVERGIHRDMSSSPVARHALLSRGDRKCYLVATPGRKRGVPYAEIQYVGDWRFFWEHRLLAQAALARAMGIAGLALAVDGRFVLGRAPRLAWRMNMPRLYRPAREDITPVMIDGLYSECMGIRV
jgi:hypothetical protein